MIQFVSNKLLREVFQEATGPTAQAQALTRNVLQILLDIVCGHWKPLD